MWNVSDGDDSDDRARLMHMQGRPAVYSLDNGFACVRARALITSRVRYATAHSLDARAPSVQNVRSYVCWTVPEIWHHSNAPVARCVSVFVCLCYGCVHVSIEIKCRAMSARVRRDQT